MTRNGHRVYWGTHGCYNSEPHKYPTGCRCDCADYPEQEGIMNVGAYPHYGEGSTQYYGEDVGKDYGIPRETGIMGIMGTDVHWAPEIRFSEGPWQPLITETLLPGARDYRLFARIAGVRAEDRGIVVLAEPRGLPWDVSEMTVKLFDEAPHRLHHRSWLTSQECFIVDMYDSTGTFTGLCRYVGGMYLSAEWRMLFAFDN